MNVYLQVDLFIFLTQAAALWSCFPGENLESKPDQPESAPPVSAFNASLCMHPLFQGWTTGAPAQHS